MLRSRARQSAIGIVTLLVMAIAGIAAAAPATAAHPHSSPGSSSVIRDWERISLRTIYTDAATPIPIGVPYLGFVSLAMYNAVQATDRKHGSAAAAAAQAAHDVLAAYFSAWAAPLQADLEASLKAIPGRGAAKERGIEAGARAARAMVESRVGDGRNDTSIVYTKTAAPGVWPAVSPPPVGGMLAPWLGFVDPLVLRRSIRVDGPDPLTSAEYTADYNEAKSLGRATGSARTQAQSDTALFFNSNSAIMVAEGVLDYLDDRPMSLRDTARMFARMHSSMTDAVITCWRLKYEVGFWRPAQAIPGADSDGNPATISDSSWTPLIANPPYSDYVSGHGCLTAPAVQIVRRTLGENTRLTLHSDSSNTDWKFKNLSDIEDKAFHARIWGGLHFRTAMEDAYYIGHQTANRVIFKIR